jgi:processive 1,2-diacylglycerol beta-glucosyltransferase/1,2-diacylglycerol 3-beta-galactosyltransferase
MANQTSERADNPGGKRQKILMVYLETGGGHITLAQILANKIGERFGANTEVILENGFGRGQFFVRSLFETGYHLTSMIARGAYSLFYDLNTVPWILAFTSVFVNWRTKTYLERLILRERVTKVVCLHFALGPACRLALDKIGKNIPFIVVVTDPFTAHPSWFLVRDAHYVVFSAEIKKHIRDAYGIRDARVFSFVLKDEYSLPAGKEGESCGKSPPLTYNVLITGGGEGLPGVISLVRCIARKEEKRMELAAGQPCPRLALTVVCGKNRVSWRILSAWAKKTRALLAVHGYVQNMPQLIKESDCVVTKAGASLTMETLALHKPLIVSTYIHGQELGNVRFVTQSGAGWFIRRPADIYKKLLLLASNAGYASRAVENVKKLGIKSGADSLADYIGSL